MSKKTGVEALTRAGERWNAGDLDGYLEMYDRNAVLHGYAGVEPGLNSISAFYREFWAAFPGSRLVFEDRFEVDGKVACRFVVNGTHAGPFQGMPATHKAISLPGITILRFDGEKCVERWSQADFLSMLQQLGALPAPPQ